MTIPNEQIQPIDENTQWEPPPQAPFEPPPGAQPAAPYEDARGVAGASIEPGLTEPVLEGQAAPEPEQAPPSAQRRRTLLDRVNQLTGRYRQTERENDDLKNQIAALSDQIRQQNESMLRLSTPRPAPVQTGSAFLDVGSSTPAEGGSNMNPPVMDPNVIGQIVARSMAPLNERLQRTEEAQALRNSHEASFAEVLREYPEFGKLDTDQRVLFDQLYQSHPLRSLPDAPAQIALMVKGLLSDQRGEDRRVASRKRAAAVHTPNPDVSDILPESENARAGRILNSARQAYARGDNSFDTYRAMRLAQIQRSRGSQP